MTEPSSPWGQPDDQNEPNEGDAGRTRPRYLPEVPDSDFEYLPTVPVLPAEAERQSGLQSRAQRRELAARFEAEPAPKSSVPSEREPLPLPLPLPPVDPSVEPAPESAQRLSWAPARSQTPEDESAAPAPAPESSATPEPAAGPPSDQLPQPTPEPAAKVEPEPDLDEPEHSPGIATTPLTERYVAVTLGYVPVAQREFAEPALRAAIADEIDERHDQLLGDEATNRSDIEIEVLEDMGEPEQVAAAMTHRPKVLIGPRFYYDYKYLLWWTLPLVAVVAGALAMFSFEHEGSGAWPTLIHGLGVALTAAVYSAALITASFSVSERVARHRAEVAAAEWTVDHLPAPTRTAISSAQTAVAVASSLLAATAIVVQELEPSAFTDRGEPVSFLNPDNWPWAWGALVVLLGANAAIAIGRHVRGFWSMRAAVGNLALLSATYGLLAWMLVGHTFLNDAFFTQVGWPTDGLPPESMESWTLIAVGVLWLIGVALGFYRAWRSSEH